MTKGDLSNSKERDSLLATEQSVHTMNTAHHMSIGPGNESLTNRSQMPKNAKGQPVQFYLCCMRRPDQPANEDPQFHFHELYPSQKRPVKDHTCKTCTNEDGKIYKAIELA